jgi:hypothetical protein
VQQVFCETKDVNMLENLQDPCEMGLGCRHKQSDSVESSMRRASRYDLALVKGTGRSHRGIGLPNASASAWVT